VIKDIQIPPLIFISIGYAEFTQKYASSVLDEKNIKKFQKRVGFDQRFKTAVALKIFQSLPNRKHYFLDNIFYILITAYFALYIFINYSKVATHEVFKSLFISNY